MCVRRYCPCPLRLTGSPVRTSASSSNPTPSVDYHFSSEKTLSSVGWCQGLNHHDQLHVVSPASCSEYPSPRGNFASPMGCEAPGANNISLCRCPLSIRRAVGAIHLRFHDLRRNVTRIWSEPHYKQQGRHTDVNHHVPCRCVQPTQQRCATGKRKTQYDSEIARRLSRAVEVGSCQADF